MSDRFTPDDLHNKGFEADGNGGFRKVRKVAEPAVKDISVELEELYPNKKITLPTENVKIKGATKVEQGGVKFDSKIEAYMYRLLQGAGIRFAFQKEYLLQEKFRYNGEAVRAITLTVDFELVDYNMIIDTKGHQTQQGALRWKLLKKQLVAMPGQHPKIEMPRTKEECDVLLNRILYDKN